jgi:phosphoglucosamine mutase
MRAAFGTPPLDRSTVEAVGYRFARLSMPLDPQAGTRPLLVLGGDTRESREEITGWLAAAARAAGAEVRSAGVVPTPAVAFLVTELGAMGGIVISASHNPWTDNGVKLIGPDGFKVDPSVEQAIEDQLAAPPDGAGRLTEEAELADRYLEHLRASSPGSLPLEGLRIAIDAANGAAAPHAARLFRSLGADCRVTCDRPDGRNINRDCGSTCTDRIVALTRETGSDLGAALDGDADRAILCDHLGRICDGDVLLYVWASHLAARDLLPGRRIVATTMSNLGLERALKPRGIEVLRCGIGDREVAATMRREGVRLGGEQSGHLLDLTLATTGDGLLTAAAVAGIVASSGRSLADLASGFRRFPQVLRNVTVRNKPPLETVTGLSDAVDAAEGELGSSGRVLLRYSGTEPLARVMIEGPDQQRIEALCNRIAQVIETELG